MKKAIISLALIIVIVLNSFIVASASAKTSLITADKIDLSNKGEQTITVKIIGNTGIMGFRLRFEYNPDEVEVVSVQPGVVTSKGNFNHNLGVNSDKFDVLWNSVADVKGDGSIVVLKVKALSKETATIKIAYSQPDTFNQDWEDVQFRCENITYKIGSEEQGETTSSPIDKGNSTANGKKGTNSNGNSKDVIDDVKDKSTVTKEKVDAKGSNAKSKEDSTFQTQPITVPKSPEESKGADKQLIGGIKDAKMIVIIVVALVLVVLGVVAVVIRNRKSKKPVDEADINKGNE